MIITRNRINLYGDSDREKEKANKKQRTIARIKQVRLQAGLKQKKTLHGSKNVLNTFAIKLTQQKWQRIE